MLHEAVVVGGGPAGASAAIGLLRRGWRVTLLEQRTHWTGRVCGAFLNPEAVNHLRWLGVLEELEREAAVVSATRVTSPGGRDVRVDTVQRGQAGLAVPREALERILLASVERLGGRVRLGCRVTNVQTNQDGWTVAFRAASSDVILLDHLRPPRAASSGTGLQRAPADLVVMSDGRFSLGMSTDKPLRGWYGWNATFENVDQRPGEMSLHFYDAGYVGVLTFKDGRANVCGLTYRTGLEPANWGGVFDQAAAAQPFLRQLLERAERATDWRGVGPLPFSRAMRVSTGPLLVGDAAAVGDPFMGEGIGRALSAGPMIHAALESSPRDAQKINLMYRAAWLRAYSQRLRLGSWTRFAMQRPTVFHWTLSALLKKPWIANTITPYFHRGYAAGRPPVDRPAEPEIPAKAQIL